MLTKIRSTTNVSNNEIRESWTYFGRPGFLIFRDYEGVTIATIYFDGRRLIHVLYKFENLEKILEREWSI